MSTKEKRRPKKFDIEYLKKITGQFSDELIIGRGGFGIVYKGKIGEGEFIAVKKLTKPETAQIDDEVINALHISHPNIVRLEGYCSTIDKEVLTYKGKSVLAEKHYSLICFEYVPNESLHAYLEDKRRVPNWNELFNIIKGICKGLHYLHEGRGGEHILHLDLKPANVLLDKGMIPKIADFGQSRLWQLNEGQAHTKNLVGTRGYMPPEYIDRGAFSKKTDIYSLGVIIMEIIAGERKHPKDGQVKEAVLGKWKKRMSETSSTLRREEYEQIETCFKIALDCMEEKPEERLDIKQVIKNLGITEDMNHHPDADIIEEHSVMNIESGEVNPLLERVGLIQRSTMADNRSTPPEIPESNTTSMRTRLRRMMNSPSICGMTVAEYISLMIALVLATVLLLSLMLYGIPSYEMSRPISISVEEAWFTRFVLVTSPSPVLTYNLSVTVGIYNPSMWNPEITKPLEAAFFFGGQRLHVVRLLGKGQRLDTMLVSMGPLSGNVTLDTADVAEYRRENSTGLFKVELVVAGQVMYSEPFTICRAQATCPFKLRVALRDSTTELEFQKVKCILHRNCSSYS